MVQRKQRPLPVGGRGRGIVYYRMKLHGNSKEKLKIPIMKSV